MYERLKCVGDEKIIKLFDTKECIFVHIPKTAGIAVKKGLFNMRGAAHTRLRDYKIIFSKSKFNKYFKFAFVRNPWDRLVSAYTFLRDGGINEADRKWSKKNLKVYNTFDNFVRGWVTKKNIYEKVHFIPQYEFINLGGMEPKVDYIARYENIESDYKHIYNKIGGHEALKKENKSERAKSYKKYYSSESKDIVMEVYKKDIKIFDYEF